MSKKSINELDLKAQPVGEIDFANIPEEFTQAPPPPHPGTYRFKLPAKDRMTMLFDTFESKDANGNPGPQCVSVNFDADDPLVIVQGRERINEGFTCKINNRPRNRAKKGEPEMLLSDGTYFLRALDAEAAKKVRNYDNRAFIDAVVAQGGKEFVADIEWSTYCNNEKQIYVQTDDGGLAPAVDEAQNPVLGCDTRYYQKDWPKDTDGRYKDRLTCKCGASLRPFGSLRNFKTAK